MRFTVQGKPHEVDQERLSVGEALQIKRATGLTVRGFLQGLREYDVDALVSLVWLARSRAGERVTIEQVIASNFDVLQDVELQPEAEDEEVGPTEGPAAPNGSAPATSSPRPSTTSTRSSTGRTGSAGSRSTSGTPPPRSTR